jgi:hypothetical protein
VALPPTYQLYPAAGLFRLGTGAELFAGRGRDVIAFETRRVALDAGEAESQLLRQERLEEDLMIFHLSHS